MNDETLDKMAAAMREAHPRNNNRENAMLEAMVGFDWGDAWIMKGMWEILENE